MGAFKDWLEALKGTIDGPIVIGGTFFPTSEEHPPVKSIFSIYPLDSVETLADLPYQWLALGMEVTVRQYELGSGTIHPRTKYILVQMPPENTRVNEVSGYDLSDYWFAEEKANFTNDVEVQYAPNYQGKRPRFLPTEITNEAYQAGYPTTELYDLGNPSDIIWSDTFDPLLNHQWIRQRPVGSVLWGIPISINSGGDYEANQYIDTIFRWVLKASPAPSRPVSPADYKTTPTGWQETPGTDYATRILTENLYYSQALKNPYGVLKSPEWTIPILVSDDPNLVRYGNTPGNTDFLNDTYWRGYYTPGLDTHMATRPNGSSSDWIIRKIDQESGEFDDFVFKNLPIGISNEDLIAATPTAPYPVGLVAPNDWSDDPPAPDENSIRYMSKSTKYPDGSLKTPWSLPRRFDGLDTILADVEVSPNDTFYQTRNASGNLVYSFSTMTLTAKLYRGNEEVTTGFLAIKFYRGSTEIVFNSSTRYATNLGVSLNQYHRISVDGLSLEINPEAVDSSQVYKIGITHETRPASDYEKFVTIKDATDDGSTYVVDIRPINGTTFKNQTGLYQFIANFFKGGLLDNSNVVFSWTIKNALGAVITNGIRNSLGASVGDENYVGSEVYVQGLDIDQFATLELTGVFGSITRTDIITLTDVEDAEAVEVLYWGTGSANPGNPTDFVDRTLTKAEVLALNIGYTEDATGAWYRIERVGGVWGGEIQIRGEAANPAGGIHLFIFKNVDFDVDGAPSAPLVPSSGSIIPSGWTTQVVPFTGGEDTTYETSCLFFLRTDVTADHQVLTRDNYTPAGIYGTPIRKNASESPPSVPGDNGWAPVIANVSHNGRVVQKLIAWIGGTGTPPSSNGSAHYLGSEGFTTIDNATNIKGDNGNDTLVRPLYHVLGKRLNRRSAGGFVNDSDISAFKYATPDVVMTTDETEVMRVIVQNTTSATRKYLVRGEVAVREVTNESKVVVRLRSTKLGSTTPDDVETNPLYVPIRDGNRKNVNVGDNVTGPGDKLMVSSVWSIAPGERHMFMLTAQRLPVTNSASAYRNLGYLEAIGL